MNEPILTPMIIIVLFIALMILNSFNKTDFSENFRKNQIKDMANDANSFMRKLEKLTIEKTKYSKRYKIETICKQAGLNIKYHHYCLLKILFSIGGAIISYLLLKNEFLSLEFLLFGQLIPVQIIAFMKNKRIAKLEKQIGPMMQMVIKRYLNTKDFSKSLKLTKNEFKGLEPLYTELKLTIAELDAGLPIEVSLDNLALRCHNKYLERFSDYYKIASSIGTQEAREKLLGQAYLQYEEDRKLKEVLKKELSEPVKDAYIMVCSVPLFSLFGFVAMEGYSDFLLNQLAGKVMLASLVGVILGVMWFINNRIGAPLK